MEKLAFLFTGQGSQFVEMSKSFYDQYEVARNTFEEANDVLGYDLAKICFEGPLVELGKTVNAQPAILVSSVVAFRVYMKEVGIAPQFLAGHSLGEYSALTCSGVIDFPDALKIIKFRGELTEEAARQEIGAMSIIDGVDQKIVEEKCKKVSESGKFVGISCFNSPMQNDISGYKEEVMKVEDELLESGSLVTPLIASAPFHCPLLVEASEKLRQELMKYKFNWFKYPVISNVTGKPYNDPEKVVDTLVQHLVKPVQWQNTMQYLKSKGITITVEMGPKNVLSKLVGANVDGIEALCYAQKEDRQTLLKLFDTYPNLKKHIPTVVTRCLAIGVATPNKNWNNDDYKEGVIKPYRRIQEIQEQLDKDGTEPTLDQAREAMENLKTVFKNKFLPLEEQIQWFKQIINETGNYYTLKDFKMPTE